MEEGYRVLIKNIVMQAVFDYKKAVGMLRRCPKCRVALGTKKEVEAFFTSEWFNDLTNLDGKKVLERLQEEA